MKGGHDTVLEDVLERGTFEKLYSYTMVLNAFSVKLTSAIDQVLPFCPRVLCFQHFQLCIGKKLALKLGRKHLIGTTSSLDTTRTFHVKIIKLQSFVPQFL